MRVAEQFHARTVGGANERFEDDLLAGRGSRWFVYA